MKKLMLILFFNSTCFAAEPSATRQLELEALLKNDCGACHGITLQGGLGLPLQAKNLENKSNSFLINTITYGRKNTAMPAWNLFLTKEDILWIVHRLRNPN